MTQRTMPFIAAAALLGVMILVAILELPMWLGTVGGILVVFSVLFWFLRSLNQKRFRGISDPLLKARVEIALDRIGMAEVPVVVVDGAGLPVIYLKQGEVLVSPHAGELLSDAELDALLLQLFCVRPDVTRREMLRYYGPWIVALLVSGAVSLYTWRPWIGPVLGVMVVWTQIDIRRRTIAKRAVEANVQSFLDRGGDASSLLSGVIKTQSAVIRSGVNQTPVVSQLRGLVETIAQLGGIAPADVERLTAHLQAPAELGAAGAAKARRQIFGLGLWAGLIVFSMLIAILLGRS